MLVGIMGKMGSGKTLTMSALGVAIAAAAGVPLYANYELANSRRIKNLGDLWAMEEAVFCFDEIWLTMDSRLWTDNVKLTRWINQTRKKSLLVLYTTQHIRQVEMRVRKGTDYLIYAERKNKQHFLTFIDYQYNLLTKRVRLKHPELIYDLYDTFEVLEPITLDNDRSAVKQGKKGCPKCGSKIYHLWSDCNGTPPVLE